jgi:hypothetical protein
VGRYVEFAFGVGVFIVVLVVVIAIWQPNRPMNTCTRELLFVVTVLAAPLLAIALVKYVILSDGPTIIPDGRMPMVCVVVTTTIPGRSLCEAAHESLTR